MKPERVARAFVRLYPRDWRARYEAELLALLDDTGVSWWTTFDIARGVAREWARVTAARFIQVLTATDRKFLVFRGLMRLVVFPLLGLLVAELAWWLGTNLDGRGFSAPAGAIEFVFLARMCILLRGTIGFALPLGRVEFWTWVGIDLVAATMDRMHALGDARLPWGWHQPQDWGLFVLMTMNPIFMMSTATKSADEARTRIRESRARPSVPIKILDL